jgi:hypothetical protein
MVTKAHFVAFTPLVALAALVAMPACSSDDKRGAPAGEHVATSRAALASNGLALIWGNSGTGDLLAWTLNGALVTGVQGLGLNTDVSTLDGALKWAMPYALGNTVLLNKYPAEFQYWNFDDNGTVRGSPAWSASCDLLQAAGISCVTGRFMGFYAGNLLWWDPANVAGNVVIGLVDGDTMFATRPVSWQCGIDNGCYPAWTMGPSADFNGDGTTDILWWNLETGEVAVWLLDPNANVVGTQVMSWTCGPGCLSAWTLVESAVDVNGDGHVDLTWWGFGPGGGGQIASWLLDGAGNVIGTSYLSSTCDPEDPEVTCRWHPIGYGWFPGWVWP